MADAVIEPLLAWIMASATPATSERGTNITAPENSVVFAEPRYIFVPFLILVADVPFSVSLVQYSTFNV